MVFLKRFTLILLLIFLLTPPSFVSGNNLRTFDTDHFTINLPAHMRQISKSEMPSVDDENSLTYVFIESDKVRKKSILLIITLEKINSRRKSVLKELSTHLQDFASHSECKNQVTKLTKTYIKGQKGYYFEKRSENCPVALGKYWTTIKGNYFVTIYLARPGKSENVVTKKVAEEITKLNLK